MTKLPTEQQCLNYFQEYKVPKNIQQHCLKVQQVAVFLGKQLQLAGVKVDLDLVRTGAVLHDLFKMAGIKDPSPNQHHSKIFTAEELAMREQLRQRFPNKFENEIAYEIFKEQFPELALVLLNEGNPFLRKRTIEESIIHYADYRIFKDRIVLLQERFAYFEKMYQAPGNFWTDYLAYCQEEENMIFKPLKIKPEQLKAVIKLSQKPEKEPR